jgi:predicted dehydrogenase
MTEQNKQNIRVAIVGTGFGKKVLLPAFTEHPRTQVVAIYHRQLDKGETIAQSHHIPFASDSIEAIAQRPDIDGVAISTPPFLHYQQAKTVLAGGKHLFLEKPTTLNAGEAKELYHLAQQNQMVTTLDFEFRFVPAWQRFAELLSENYVGEKRLIKIDCLVSGRADADQPWTWYAQKELGGGILGAMGSHCFDYISWLFGPIRRLCGQLATTIKHRPDPATSSFQACDADDVCQVMLELADGTPCQLSLSAVTYQGRGHSIEVYGSEGTLILASDNQQDYIHGFKLWGSQKGATLAPINVPARLDFPKVYPDGRIAAVMRVIDQWVAGIDQGKSMIPSLVEGTYSQLLIDLTQESNMTGTWVDVPTINQFLEGMGNR